MKKLLLAVAFSVISVGTLQAKDTDVSRLAEPGALILLLAGIGGSALWLRNRR
jgi:hypothetical protein